MYVESLFRIAQIIDEFNKNGDKLISEKFHKDTEDLIFSQTEFLKTELEFRKENPGPYDFGFGDLTISIFSPDQTEMQEWAMITRKGNIQKNYRFNSIMGLIKSLSQSIELNDKPE